MRLQLDVRYGGGLTAGGLVGAGVTTGQPGGLPRVHGRAVGDRVDRRGGQVPFSDDPDGLAPALQTLYAGIGTGGEQWSGTMTQYCDGAPVGATACEEGDTQIPYPTGGVLAGVWYDDSVDGRTAEEKAGPTGHQLAAEAEAAATHFGNTDQAANRDAQYVIASPTGTDPDGWDNQTDGYCAYHDDTHDTSIDGGGAVAGPIVAFTNLPYVPDAGYDCGAGDLNTPGTLDGATEAASHEYAETITDQFPEADPAPGWMDAEGEEVADLCAYLATGPGRDVQPGHGRRHRGRPGHLVEHAAAERVVLRRRVRSTPTPRVVTGRLPAAARRRGRRSPSPARTSARPPPSSSTARPGPITSDSPTAVDGHRPAPARATVWSRWSRATGRCPPPRPFDVAPTLTVVRPDHGGAQGGPDAHRDRARRGQEGRGRWTKADDHLRRRRPDRGHRVGPGRPRARCRSRPSTARRPWAASPSPEGGPARSVRGRRRRAPSTGARSRR